MFHFYFGVRHKDGWMVDRWIDTKIELKVDMFLL